MDDELQGLKPLDQSGQAEVLPDQAQPVTPDNPTPDPVMLDRRAALQTQR